MVEQEREKALGASELTVLGKVHRILTAFTIDEDILGLTELARRSGVSKATAYRLAEQLVDLRYLVKTTQGYQLGWLVYELGQAVPGPALLRSVARPLLVDLRTTLKALVIHLAVPNGEVVSYLERIGGRREITLLAAVAASVPAQETVSGRLLQAYAEHGREEQLPNSVRDERNLIRQRRWASEHGTIVPGTKSFAVAIEYPSESHVGAALSATVHAERTDDQAILHTLWAASAEISRGMQRLLVR